MRLPEEVSVREVVGDLQDQEVVAVTVDLPEPEERVALPGAVDHLAPEVGVEDHPEFPDTRE